MKIAFFSDVHVNLPAFEKSMAPAIYFFVIHIRKLVS